ncbi:MAG TPA: App1 family protein [Vicinamibacterales bacterium]|nr:App1 family protein [Vicinamibacterales bacterium]
MHALSAIVRLAGFAIVLAVVVSALPRAAQIDGEEVIFYPTYGFRQGASWVIPLRAKVQEPRDVKAVFTALFAGLPARGTDDTARFRARIADFLADDESGESVRLRFERDPDNVEHRMTDGRGGFPETDGDGVVEGVITLADEAARRLLERQASSDGWLSFRATSSEHRGTGRVRLIEPAGVSVVSDVDDTVKVTEIPAGASTVAVNTFYRPFVATTELAGRYAGAAAFHYVSGGPWQIYRPVSAFLAGEGRFPEGSFHMRRIGGSITRPVTSLEALSQFVMAGGTFEHKVSAITTLMERFPGRTFVLIGDSGEQDPEVYQAIASRFGGRVLEIVIRDVVNARERDPKRLAGMTVVPAPTVSPR